MSFDQDPGESVTLSGADFALMKDEIERLRAVADLHAIALARAQTLGFSSVELALGSITPKTKIPPSPILDAARRVLEEGLTLHEQGRRGGMMADALSLVVGGPCKICGQPQISHASGKCPEPPRLFRGLDGVLRERL